MEKKEGYIKELLARVFAGVGTFQQFEFSSQGMSHRPDFVILQPRSFTYFEIKSEYDSLTRLSNQILESRKLFTHMFLVAPMKHIEKARETITNFDHWCGAYALEDLEAGKIEPMFRQRIPGHVSIEAVANILWVEELCNYIKDVSIFANGKKWSKTKLKQRRVDVFKLIYSNDDALKILNDVLPNRHWGYREERSYREGVQIPLIIQE